jgi:hypothetical protein
MNVKAQMTNEIPLTLALSRQGREDRGVRLPRFARNDRKGVGERERKEQILRLRLRMTRGAQNDRTGRARAELEWHDLERSHYNRVLDLGGGIAALPLRYAQGFGSPE